MKIHYMHIQCGDTIIINILYIIMEWAGTLTVHVCKCMQYTHAYASHAPTHTHTHTQTHGMFHSHCWYVRNREWWEHHYHCAGLHGEISLWGWRYRINWRIFGTRNDVKNTTSTLITVSLPSLSLSLSLTLSLSSTFVHTHTHTTSWILIKGFSVACMWTLYHGLYDLYYLFNEKLHSTYRASLPGVFCKQSDKEGSRGWIYIFSIQVVILNDIMCFMQWRISD